MVVGRGGANCRRSSDGACANETKPRQDSTASIAELTSETEELTTKISSAEADLNEATSVRTDGRTDFEAQEKELVETVRGQRDSTMWGRDTRADESGAGS